MESLLLNLAFDNAPTPQMPEALAVKRESELLGIPYIEGDIYSLPYIYRLEMKAVIEAESEYLSLKRLIESFKAKQNANQPPTL